MRVPGEPRGVEILTDEERSSFWHCLQALERVIGKRKAVVRAVLTVGRPEILPHVDGAAGNLGVVVLRANRAQPSPAPQRTVQLQGQRHATESQGRIPPRIAISHDSLPPFFGGVIGLCFYSMPSSMEPTDGFPKNKIAATAKSTLQQCTIPLPPGPIYSAISTTRK